jgi:hypothetical protein
MRALTVERAARRAGVAEDRALAEFPEPSALIRAVMTEDETRFVRELDERYGNQPAGVRLRALFQACVLEYDWTFWIELWSEALREPWAAELRRELDDVWRQGIVELLRDGVAAGEFADVDAERASLVIAGLLDGFATQATLGDSRVTPNYMWRTCSWAAGRILSSPLESPPEVRDA